MDTTRFVFEGFLPLKKGRQTRLRQLAQEERTVVMYESPHRIKRLLRELAEVCGANREVAVARELTKIHEQFHRGSLEQVAAELEERFPESVKGECVVILAGANARNSMPESPDEE
jgi:16S rRNA (cytidine1402-2'-O)-methyltransferase